MRATVTWLVAMGWWTACATAAPPKELSEARSLYQSAARSDAIHDDPYGLLEAEMSLEAADQAFAREPASAETFSAAREALTRIHRWQFMVQLERLDEAMERVLEADALGEPYGTGHFNRRPDAQMRVGALCSAVGTRCGLKKDAESLTLEFPAGALFQHGDGELTAVARARLEQTAEALARHTPDARVRVVAEGYTQLDPERAVDQARTVRDYLIEAGVAPDQVTFAMGGATRSRERGRMAIVVQPPLDPTASER